MGRKRLNYDDDALVEMIAEGQMTYKAIGQKLGISEVLVKQIARGRRRRELGQRLWDAENGILTEARRVATQYARTMVMEQVRLGLRGEGEPARRAREYVLKFASAGRPRRKDVPGEQERRPEWMLQLARETGPTPWEDELDAQREREAAEEEARNREALTAEKAENAEREEARNGESCSAKATQDESTSAKDTEDEPRSKATQDGPCAAPGEEGQAVVAEASMPATGVLGGGAAGTAREAAGASIPDASAEHPLSIL